MAWLLDPAVLPWVHLATFGGVLVSLVALAVTLANVIRARHTAERVEIATQETLRAVRQFDTLLAITAAMEMIEDLKRVHRDGVWVVALERYPLVLRQIDLIREAGPDLAEAGRVDLQRIGNDIRDMAHIVESLIARKIEKVETEALNAKLTDAVRKLHRLQIQIRRQLGV